MIGLIEDGDRILIDVRDRARSSCWCADEVLAERRAKMDAARAAVAARDRDRPVTKALRAYAALATSADRGAVREVP